ncbi:dihydrodipicolinate synthase family protein [Aestuariimicrobium sp. p3-SID1156]|uniref:dihydrodipicolinate synthase family protein n=1 Tax=Aestuariimicrobium sp. p3-SID1156 TaxID=2916038 RepID=UPI00223B0C7B|nr:dihydrodipicolinate synthase family protein [Aestuariimicrobium sp. p3-SID1156]
MFHPLRGVVPPVSTPFTPELSIDTSSLSRLVDHLLNGGVHGLFALGSTSEAAFLTDQHRDTVVATIVERAADRVPVVAGVIDMTTLLVVEHIRRAKDLGAQGIVATAPFYTRTHPVEIRRHYELIKEAAGDLPVYAYDLPVSVGTKLDAVEVLPLLEEGILAGVKDSSGSDAGLRALILGAQEKNLHDVSLLTGSELTVDGALLYGASGVVPGLGNVDPAGYVRLWEACQEGDYGRARAEQERLFRMFGLVNVAAGNRMGRGSSALGAFKAALKLLGLIDCALTAPPYVPLSNEEIAAIVPYLREAGLTPSEHDPQA